MKMNFNFLLLIDSRECELLYLILSYYVMLYSLFIS